MQGLVVRFMASPVTPKDDTVFIFLNFPQKLVKSKIFLNSNYSDYSAQWWSYCHLSEITNFYPTLSSPIPKFHRSSLTSIAYLKVPSEKSPNRAISPCCIYCIYCIY